MHSHFAPPRPLQAREIAEHEYMLMHSHYVGAEVAEGDCVEHFLGTNRGKMMLRRCV